jgi:Zn-dependent peptidase ImmA (M78 family)/transcriptional regulator with XRE-family HTH domain
MKHFAERLKVARKMNGFSLQDLSDAINNKLSKQQLNRLETGDAKPDSEIISLLSKSLKVNSNYFFRETTVSLEEVRFRKLKKLPVKEQDRVTAQTIDFLERYFELEDLYGLNNTIKFKPKSFKITNSTDVEVAAQQLRQKWSLGTDPLPNIVEMLEENNIKVFRVKVDKSFSGMSTILQDKIAVVVLNKNEDIPVVRKRFTALHELAHLYLDLTNFEDKECEKMCDLFAGAMLLPEEKIKQYLGEKRGQIFSKELLMIAELYGISLSAIMYRAFTLNIISASYHKFFMIKYNQYNTKAKEFNVYSGKETSERFLQLLIRAVAEEIISTTKAASLNNQRLGDFRELLDNVEK